MHELTARHILTSIEALDPMACGAFVVRTGEITAGTVFVERKQVCWAASSGLRKRLRDLLREHLAHALKDEAMRLALRQHTIESLVALPQDQGEQVEWVPHRHEGYKPRFTFSPTDLLIGVNAFLYASEADGAERAIAAVDIDAPAVTFVTGDGEELVAIHATSTLPIAVVDELANWASAAFGVSKKGFTPVVMRRAIDAAQANGHSEVRIAWQSSKRHTHAAVMRVGASLERLVTSLEPHRFPTIVTVRTNPRS